MRWCGKSWNKKWIEWQVFVHWLQCSYIHSLFASVVIAILSISSFHWLPQRRCAKERSEEIDCTIWCVFLSFLLLLLFHWLLYTHIEDHSVVNWCMELPSSSIVVEPLLYFSQSNITLTQMLENIKNHTHIQSSIQKVRRLHACVLDIVDVDDDDG